MKRDTTLVVGASGATGRSLVEPTEVCGKVPGSTLVPIMLSILSQVAVFAFTKPVDFRKQHDSLFGIVQNQLKENPLDGSLNRRRDRGIARRTICETYCARREP